MNYSEQNLVQAKEKQPGEIQGKDTQVQEAIQKLAVQLKRASDLEKGFRHKLSPVLNPIWPEMEATSMKADKSLCVLAAELQEYAVQLRIHNDAMSEILRRIEL